MACWSRPNRVAARPGAAPRHIDFHPTKALAYVINELDSTITTYRQDRRSGALTPLQTIPSTPADFTGYSTGAEIAVDRAGRNVYVTNRGHDSVGVFAIDPAKGTLAPRQWVPTQGRTPRFFTFDPASASSMSPTRTADSIVGYRVGRDGQIVADTHPGQGRQPGLHRFRWRRESTLASSAATMITFDMPSAIARGRGIHEGASTLRVIALFEICPTPSWRGSRTLHRIYEPAAQIADTNALGVFDVAVSATLDLGYERGDQLYRNMAKIVAGAIAIGLTIAATLLVHGGATTIRQLVIAVLVGLVATPLAPVAKDMASALQTAVKAIGAVRR